MCGGRFRFPPDMAKIPGPGHQVAVWWTARELAQALGFGMITGAPHWSRAGSGETHCHH